MTTVTTDQLYRIEQLKAEADAPSNGDYPENWFPESPGAEIGGVFLRYADAHTREGETVQVAHIRVSDGTERSVWLKHKVLADSLEHLQPGDAVYIRYEGKKTSKAGFEYSNYTVRCDPDRSHSGGSAF